MRPPRKLRRTPEDRSLQIGKRMSAGTAQGRVDSASPVRNTIPAKATQRRGGDCVNEEFTWFEPGTATVGTGTDRWYPPFEVKLFSLRASVNTAPTGAPIKIDLKKNGVSVLSSFVTPTIAIGTYTVLVTTILDPLMALGDYLTVDVTQVGSTIAGSDLAVTIGFTVCPSSLATPGTPPPGPCDDFLASLSGSAVVFATDWHTGDTSELTFGTGGFVGNATSDPTHFGSVTDLTCSTYEYTGANQSGPGFSGSFYLSDLTELYIRTEIYIQSSGLIKGGEFLSFGNNSPYGSTLIPLHLNASGKLEATLPGSVFATASSALVLDAWHQLDAHLKMSTTTGICDVMIDGASSPYGFTFAGKTANAVDWLVQYVQLINPQTTQNYFFGRLAVSTP